MGVIQTFLSPGGQQHTFGTSTPNEILVGTLEGLVKLEKMGNEWQITKRSLSDRHVGQIIHEPVSGKIFVGCHAGGGLWVNDDGKGQSWRQLTNGIDRPHIYALAVRKRGKEATLFAGTSPPALYRSDDLGESWSVNTSIYDVADTEKWTFPPPPHIPHIKQIVLHPDEKETFFVLVEQGAFLKTIDDGASFIDLTGYARPEDANYRDPHRLIIDKDDTQKMWLCSGVGLYRTDDGGTTYAHLMKRGERIGYCDFAFIDPQDSHTIYQGGSTLSPNDWFKNGLSHSCVMKSVDNGISWRECVHGLPTPMVGSIQAMTQHNWEGGMTFFLGTATGEIYLSHDKAETWELVHSNVAPIAKDNHHLPFMSTEERQEPRAHMGR